MTCFVECQHVAFANSLHGPNIVMSTIRVKHRDSANSVSLRLCERVDCLHIKDICFLLSEEHVDITTPHRREPIVDMECFAPQEGG